MDSVERVQGFTVTRDGHEIGELIPLRHKRTFVGREEFMALGPRAASRRRRPLPRPPQST